jgi:hypothetical protein
MSVLGRTWRRLRGKKEDPTFGTQIAAVAVGAAIVTDQANEADPQADSGAADYGWSGDHLSGGSDLGGGGGGLDGGGFGGGDSGGGGGF